MKTYVIPIVAILLFSIISLKALAINAPVLTYPSNSALNIQGGTLLKWDAVSGATGYIIETDTNPAFSSFIFQQFNANQNSLIFADLFFGKKYFWRVAAYNATDTSVWSPAFNFTVTNSGPSLVLPLNNATNIPGGALLDWNNHYFVIKYEFEYDTVSTFNSTVKVSGFINYIDTLPGNTDTEVIASHLFYGKKYFWRVRSVNNVNSSPWSVRNFDVSNSGPALASPANNSVVKAGTILDWNSHHYVSFYDYQLDTVPTYNSPALVSGIKNYLNTGNNNSDTKAQVGDLYYGKNYYWRVRSRNNNDISPWSERIFTTQSTVGVTSPANGATNLQGAVTIDWDSHWYVQGYDYQFDTTIVFNSPYAASGSLTYLDTPGNGNDTRFQINDFYFGKTYYWRVRSYHTKDTSDWTAIQSFSITPTGPVMVAPANYTLNVPVSGIALDWNSQLSVNVYFLEVDVTNQFNSPALLSYIKNYISAGNNNSDTEQQITPLQPNTIYYWRLRSANLNDTSEWSPVWAFSTGSSLFIIPTEPILNSPANFSTNQNLSVLLDWDAVEGINEYEFEVDTDQNFTSPSKITGTKNYISFNNNNPDTEHLLSNLSYSATYFWRVRTKTTTAVSDWSETWTFTTLSPFVPSVPFQVSPVNGSQNQPYSVKIDWNSVTGAQYYNFEVDTVNTFSSLAMISGTHNFISSSDNNPDTEYNLIGLSAGKTYYWRVRAKTDDTTSAWSPVWDFSTSVVTGINEENKVITGFFPNPAKDKISLLYYSAKDEKIIIDIFSITGQLIDRSEYFIHTGQNNLLLSLDKIESGIYILNMEIGHELLTKRLIIQK